MAQLPIELEEAFPAIITHIGAESREVADLKPCTGVNLLSNYVKKNKKEVEGVGDFFKSAPTIYAPFSSFDYQSGYDGYVSTPVYFRTLYTSIIEKLRPFMDEMLMLTSGKIIRGDHSFKIVNHIAKIENSSAFTALYTVFNEYEEIRLMSLVPSKSHSYLKWSFEKIYEACKMYGHELPTVFLLTMCSKAILQEYRFNYKTLPELELPDFVNVGYFNQFLQIETVIFDLNDKLSIECEGTVAVGFDRECSFDEETIQFTSVTEVIFEQQKYCKGWEKRF
ncbi:hypothetical protein INT47_007393 [Mucor saturninus]|uniref:Uncharacterized protein n=1 Tax=Mucor saturninus TaxID=64648 RepID=A0A8H7QKZ1_9FUNG|nr:hypothetical protein INT47_007393 [Mucor saturninus]